ncbi:MAG: serine hydrolase [Thermoanaerobaculia bacterium]
MQLFTPGARRTAGALLILTAAALPATAAAAAKTPDLATYADQLLAKSYPAGKPGASAIVIKDGKAVLRKGYGTANLELGVPVSPDMVFELGSITKQFTAAAILLLQERGQLRVEDDITKYLTDFPTDGKAVTIENLLTHTSGVPSYTGLPEWRPRVREEMKLDTLIGLFKGKPLEFNPGESWAYSNSGYILLGAIIEKASGKTYEQFVEEEIFQKLGMKDSRYGHADEVTPRRASGYTQGPDGVRNAEYLSMTQPYAAGSLMSTVDDLAVWARALTSEALLKKPSLDRMFTPYHLKSGKNTGYGYGIGVGRLEGRQVLKHNGGIFGFSTDMIVIPEERLVVAVLCNSDAADPRPDDMTLRIAAKALGKPIEDWKAVALDPKTLQEYAGTYKFDGDTVRYITAEGAKLFSQRKGGEKKEILASARDEFYFEDAQARLHFRRDAQGKVTGVDMDFLAGVPEAGTRTDEPLPKEKQAVQVDPQIYDDYAGEYELAPGFSIVVTREGDHLMAQPTGQPKLEVFPESETVFFLKVVDAQLEFVRGEGGKVTGVILHQGGRNREGKRK